MSKTTHGPLTYIAGGTIGPYRLVKFATGKVVVCTATATDEAIGVTGETGYVVNDVAKVTPLNTEGSIHMMASEALTQGEAAFQGADGKLTDLPASGATVHRRVGMVLEASTADGDVIEIMPEKSGFTVTAPV